MNNLNPKDGIFSRGSLPVLLCFSHLRWNFVYQRPQHLMSHAAKNFRVLYIEEPLFEPVTPNLRIQFDPSGVCIITPILNRECDHVNEQRRMIAELMVMLDAPQVLQWFYTPMALELAANIRADLVIYDCMDELTAFRFAPVELRDREKELLARADLVFTGGASLFAAKRLLHAEVLCYPSSVDREHFGQARNRPTDPLDQAALPHPRIGYFGVIDERMDLNLVARASSLMPDVQFVMVGPVVKIDPAHLPKAHNIHWLGSKSYADLPAYLGNWQAGWMPFALNEHTRFISPTKTPEFLAAGLPVTSTAVADVVADWGREDLVRIADPESMVAALQASLGPQEAKWRRRVDDRLSAMSWDETWRSMQAQIVAKLHLGVTA